MSDTIPETTIAQPPTPNLDKLSDVHERSNEIGDFVVEFLASKGIVLAEWKEIREPCWKMRSANRSLFSSEPDEVTYSGDPFACDCPPVPNMSTPHTHREMVMVFCESVIQPLLAEYFGIDYAAIETERRALLDYVRSMTPTPRTEPRSGRPTTAAQGTLEGSE